MNFVNEDVFNASILIIFVLIIFFIGKFKTNHLNSIYAFSIGNRDFSTTVITCTLIATWVSGSGFRIKLQKFYENGWNYLLPTLGMICSILFIIIVVIPRAHRMLGITSVASYMEKYYGKKVRVITAIVGIFSLSGCIAIQFKILGEVAYYLWPILSQNWWSFLLGGLTVYYCYSGGIRSVIYTDVAQVVIFTTAFIIGIVLLQMSPKADISNEDLFKFNIISIFDNTKEEWITMLSLFFYFLVPALNPAEFQRISLGVNTKQVQLSWIMSGIGFLFVISVSCYIAYQLFLIDPKIKPDQRLLKVLDLFGNLRVLLIIGILSMCMSTADSCINISAIMLANDTFKKDSWDTFKKFQVARWYTILIGLLSYGFMFLKDDLLELIMFTTGFYMPLITIPLIITVFNYKISERCVLISMGITATFWSIWQVLCQSEPLIFTMTLNAFLLFTTHHLIDKKYLERFGIRSKLKGK